MDYSVRLEIKYDFPRPTGGGRQLLRIIPAQHKGQSRSQCQIDITPSPSERHEFTDFFGTEVIELALPAGATEFKVVLQTKVSRNSPPDELQLAPLLAGLKDHIRHCKDMTAQSPHHFLPASSFVPQVPEITAFAAALAQEDATVVELVEALGRGVHERMIFDADATEVQTPIATSFAKRRGVCQDFSQIMIAGLRSLGIPAGYVAGYLRTLPPAGQTRLQGADAMHAWVRAWAGPEIGWVDYDPTNICWVKDDHITVGYGRDYADVAPVTGSLILEGDQSGRHSVDIIET